jgi:hypothetical protein
MNETFASTIVLVSLVTARTWGLLRVQAVYRCALPGTWWAWSAALAATLGFLSISFASPVPWPGLARWFILAGMELALGTALGLVVTLPGYAVIGASRESFARLGLAAERTSTVAMVAAISIAGGLALGLHRPLLLAWLETLDRWEPGLPATWVPPAFDVSAVAMAAADLSFLALALATPVLLTAAVMDVASAWVLRVSARPASALHTWARFSACLIALGASWEAYSSSWWA